MTDTLAGRRFIAAAAPVGGSTKVLYSDLPFADTSAEPVEDVAKAMLALGVQPESVKALVERTRVATAKRLRRKKKLLDLTAQLRKAVGSDEAFELVVTGQVILFPGIKRGAIFKAKHAQRSESSGRFHPSTVGGFKIGKDSGRIHPALVALAEQEARASHGKTHPANEDKPIPGTYGNNEDAQNPGGGFDYA